MSTHDDFTATVGVALIESAGLLPWTAPLPPALAGARGWFLPTASAPSAVFVLPADALDGDALTATVAAWRAWLAGLRVADAVLLLVTSDAGEDAEPRGAWPEHPRWQPWQVDLASRRIDRPAADEGPAPEGPAAAAARGFGQVVDAAIVAFFQGPPMTLADLAEQERGRLAGKPPFLAWIDGQPAPASYLLVGLVLGLYFVSALLTLQAAGPPPGRPFLEVVRAGWDALLYPSPIALLQLGAQLGPLVAQGEAWRLLAANYLHGFWAHLLVSLFSIAAMAPSLEKLFGTPRFLAIWVVAGLAGALASVGVNREAMSVGSSGSLFGLVGAMFALGTRFPGAIPSHQVRSIRQVAVVLLVVNLGIGLAVPHVDNMAHLGGLAGGFAAAFVLGPHPALTGRRPRWWDGRALWAWPALALSAIAMGLAASIVGPMPQVPLVGPTRDYAVTLPIDVPVNREPPYLIVRGLRGDHYVLVHSVPNPEGTATADRPAFTEATLDRRVYEVARRYASQGARLVDAPAVVSGGHHRFLMVPVAMPEGGREEIYVTASPERIYAIRTRGLTEDAWVARMRDQMLATFEMRTP